MLAKPLIPLGAFLQGGCQVPGGDAGRVLVAMGVALGRMCRGMLTAAAGGAKLEALTPLGAMSDDQLKAFLAAVEADAGLQEQLKAAGDADAVVAIAKAAGFVISAEELKRAKAEISEEELESVAGGVPTFGQIYSQGPCCS